MDPILTAFITKGIDFLWNEATRIIATYRSSERVSDSELSTSDRTTSDPSIVGTPLKRRVKWDSVRLVEMEMQSLIEQVHTHRKNLNYNLEQQANMGNLAPVSVINSIKLEQESLLRKGKRLKELIEKVYGESISFTFESP